MVIASTLHQDYRAWSSNPTPRTHARLIASMARMSEEMNRRGMQDVYHSDARASCPRELRAMLELFKRREERGLVAA